MDTNKKVFFTIRELLDRYDLRDRRTILAWQKSQEFPEGNLNGKSYRIPAAKVIAWEKVHMPHLHDAPNVVEEEPEQTARWARMRDEHERRRDRKVDTPPPMRAKRRGK